MVNKTLAERLTPEERRRAALLGDPDAAGWVRSPEMVSRDKMRQLLKDPDWVEEIMDGVAEGRKLTALAREYGVRYGVFHRLLKEQHHDRLVAARAAYAEEAVSKNMNLADEVEAGRVDSAAAKTASGIRQWYAERASNDDWGQKTTANVNVKGTIGLHMEAIKQFANEPLEGEYREVEHLEDTSQDDTSNATRARLIRDHPLL